MVGVNSTRGRHLFIATKCKVQQSITKTIATLVRIFRGRTDGRMREKQKHTTRNLWNAPSRHANTQHGTPIDGLTKLAWTLRSVSTLKRISTCASPPPPPSPLSTRETSLCWVAVCIAPPPGGQGKRNGYNNRLDEHSIVCRRHSVIKM